MTQKSPTDIDCTVGLRIAALRKAKGLSQAVFGTAVGVTAKQVRKYEQGLDRIGASRLRAIASLLEVPISTLFDEGREESNNETFALLEAHGAVDLLRDYAAIEDKQMRSYVLALVRTVVRLGATPVAGEGIFEKTPALDDT